RYASSSTSGTIRMPPSARLAIQRSLAPDGIAARGAGMPAPFRMRREATSQIAKTAAPTAMPRQPKRQSSLASGRQQQVSAAAAAMSLRAYQVSKPLDAAREIMPAANTARKGRRYAAVGLEVVSAASRAAARFSQRLCRVTNATPQATQLKPIQPASEWKPYTAIAG